MSPPHLVVTPLLAPLAGAAVGILLRRWRRVQGAFSLAVLLASLAASLVLLAQVWRGGPLVFAVGDWPAPAGIVLVADLLSAMMVAMSQVVLAAGVLYGLGCKDHCAQYPTFYPVFLTLAAGLTGALLSGDLFNLYVFAELMVISGAMLTAISDDRYGPEAAYKYFYISLLAAVFLLLAVAALYASYGTLNLADLAQRIAAAPQAPLAAAAMAGMLVFFMVKSAVVPFHFWQPDFHTAAPTPVHAVLSSVVVKLGVYGFLRMTTLLFIAEADGLRLVLLVLGAVGVIFGGLGAVGTYDAKRMLAYSTLGQIGYILVGIGWGTPLALAAALVFAFNHSLIKSAMLMLAGAVASRAPVKTAAFEAVTGLGRVAPAAGALFLLGGLALAGIPPLNGFISKMALVRGGLQAGAGLSLAAIALGSLITLVYVFRAFQHIWWAPLPEGVRPKPRGDRLLAPAVLIGLCLALGVWAEPLLRLAGDTVAWLGDPAAYIRAVLGP